MRWVYLAVGLVFSLSGCKDRLPPIKESLPEAQVSAPTTVRISAVQTAQPLTKSVPKTSDNFPVCEKSSMPGYTDGKALEAAIDGFNARGSDIDACNERIREWAKSQR